MIDAKTLKQTFDLLSFAEGCTRLKKVARSEGGEWAGACPMCGGENRFAVQPNRSEPRWLCRHCTEGKWRDSIELVQRYLKCDFKTALIRMGGQNIDITPEEAARRAMERAKQAEKELEEAIKKGNEALEELRKAQKWIQYKLNLEHSERGRAEWEKRGIPEVYQQLFQLGYDENHSIYTDNGRWNTPTLAIPLFQPGSKECMNVRHRLLVPPSSGDKYRPERAGLPPSLWCADPDIVNPKIALVVEGEIKAMVAWLTADNPNIQAFGIPGKCARAEVVADAVKQAAPVYLCLDPDAQDRVNEYAEAIGRDRVRNIVLPGKIDDMIIENSLSREWVNGVLKQARKVIA